MKKIVLEEHFITPDFVHYTMPYYKFFPENAIEGILGKLSDFDDQRIEEMNKGDIDIAVISLTSPGVQNEPDVTTAINLARKANDILAEKIKKNPDRFRGFAHLPLQDPLAAAVELERCVRDYQFVGALINGQTGGHYLDEERYYPFWEKVQELDVPIYLHPSDFYQTPHNLVGYDSINNAIWGWTVETATHALRLIFGGTFDRFPGAKLILGHMGETLPYLLWRFDSQTSLRQKLIKDSKSIKKLPSQYIKDNVFITTSGVFSNGPLLCALDAIGEENVMFSIDYPYESVGAATQFIDNAPISDSVREKICYKNAKRILKI